MRSELASAPLPQYGVWLMFARFRIPSFWSQDSVCFWYSATNDAGEEDKQSALNIVITGDELKLVTRNEASPIYNEACNVAVAENTWYSLAILANLTPGGDGYFRTTLDGEVIATLSAGPTWWDDAAPPFYGFGVYGGWNGSDPMTMEVSDFTVQQVAALPDDDTLRIVARQAQPTSRARHGMRLSA